MRDQPGLDAFLRDVYNPSSPNFRKFLTPAQLTERFGPTAADYQAVIDFVKAQGLAVTGAHANRLIIDVDGTTANIEKVFHTTIQVYQHPKENRTFYAPVSEPSIDLATPILHVTGLDNYFIPQPLIRHNPMLATNGTALFGSGPGGNYLGDDFRAAYVPGVELRGEGQSVALFELDGYFPSDISAYEQQGGLVEVPLNNVLIDGFTGAPYSGGQTEVTLDIDMVVAMAPGLKQILVYESTNGIQSAIVDQLNRIATDDQAEQISSSWGLGDDPVLDQIYQTFAAQGQSFFQAAGDSGAFVPFNGQLDSDSPYVTLVGGTTLFTSGPKGNYVSESVWNWSSTGEGDGSGGGGISTTYPLPVWQEGIANASNLASTQFRNCPDVAMVGDNIYIIADNGVAMPGTGGTSCAAPLWASFMAMVNEQGLHNGQAPIGFANPAIYALGKSPSYESIFHDVVTGSNTNAAGGPIDFPAVLGYDLASGWGSPTSALIDALAPPAGPILQVFSSIVFGGNGDSTIDPNDCKNLTVVITNAGPVEATGVEGVLVSDSFPGISVGQAVVTFPDIPPFSIATATVSFTLSSGADLPCGAPVQLALTLKSDQNTTVVPISLTSGREGAPVTFSANPIQPVTIPINASGASMPLQVSGLQSIAHITASVFVSAQSDAGLTLELISPSGKAVTLASGDGGLAANYGAGCGTSAETTFDDAAGLPLSDGAAPFLGSYTPDHPLSVFNLMAGAGLNGTWQLRVVDEFPSDTAQINCWSLTITPFVCASGTGPCSGSDLSLTMTAAPSSAIVGSNFVCYVVASNAGPSPASDIAVQLTFQPGVGFVAATNASQGLVSGSAGGATWAVGALPVGGSASVSIVALDNVPDQTTTIAGTIASSSSSDPNPANNNASASVVVERPGADLGVTMVAQPNPALENGRITYSIFVTNNGPFDADGAVLTTVIPNVNFVSGSTTQGVLAPGGASVEFGTIPVNGGAMVTLVESPTTTGNITATATVSLSITNLDPLQGNNSASVTTTVNSSADLGVTASASPKSSIIGSNIVYVATFTNRGPATASSVVLTHLFPVGSHFVATSASGPNVETNDTSLIWNLGVLSNGFGGSITTILSAPTNPGTISSEFTIFGQPGDPNTNDNIVVLTTVNSNAFLKVVPAGALIAGADALNPGDTVSVSLILQNVGNVPTGNLMAILLAGNGVTSPSPAGPTRYGVNGILAPGQTATNTFRFTVVGTNGGLVVAQLALSDGSTSLGTVSFNFTLPFVTTFWNSGFISIPDQGFIPLPDSGPANPYPSTVVVSGISGLVSGVTVTVSNLSHTFPTDISMLLVSPTGLESILMSSNALGSQMTNVTVTYTSDPNAPFLPQFGSIVSGSYQPTDYGSSNYFPAPAPPGPYSADLSVFAGAGDAVNGQWSLYIFDNGQGDSGSIAQGWALSVKTIVPINKVADLDISVVTPSNQMSLGNTATFAVTVANAGPDATTASVVNTMPPGLTFVSAALPQGSFAANGQQVTYDLGDIAAGGSVSFTTTATANAVGSQVDTFVVASDDLAVFDPVAANNTASATITVGAPVADVVALATPPLAPVVVGRGQIYTLMASNAGPQIAQNVTGLFNLTGLTFVAATSSQGIATAANGAVSCSFGNLAVGNIATVQITAAPLTNSPLTNAWVVGTASMDPALANNAASVVVNVLSPAPIVVAGPALLLTSSPNNTIASNETVTVSLVLSNAGYSSTTNLTAILQASNGISPITGSQTYGAIAAGSTAAQPFTFIARGMPGATVTATLLLTDGSVSYGAVSYPFTLPNSLSFANHASIVIPDFGPAAPYPSAILVSGATGVISKVTATIQGFSHTFPRDVNILLSGPAGQQTLLMAHVGGPYSVTNLTLTFDDGAVTSLPTTALASGTFLSTANAPTPTLPGFFFPTFNTSLSVFDGTDPNGIWSLYVDDDSAGNGGMISQGWDLNLSLVSPLSVFLPPAQWQASLAGNDVQLTLSAGPNQTYVVQISSDLVSWTPLLTNVTSSDGTFTITDRSTNAPRRFFRAVQTSR